MKKLSLFEAGKIAMVKRDKVNVLLAEYPENDRWMLRRQDDERIVIFRDSRTEVLRIAVEHGLFVYNI
jgi:hypothetical protein